MIDGLVGARERWGGQKLNLNRFRYVGDNKVDADGDERAFLFTSGQATDLPPPSWLANCAAGPVGSTCITACIGTRRSEFVVMPSQTDASGWKMVVARDVGSCDGSVRYVLVLPTVIFAFQTRVGELHSPLPSVPVLPYG